MVVWISRDVLTVGLYKVKGKPKRGSSYLFLDTAGRLYTREHWHKTKSAAVDAAVTKLLADLDDATTSLNKLTAALHKLMESKATRGRHLRLVR